MELQVQLQVDGLLVEVAVVHMPEQQDLEVLDPDTLQPVPRDGETIGEIMFKGNVVMRGYLKNEAATNESLGALMRRRQMLVPPCMAIVQGKHQPQQWNMGKVQRYTGLSGMLQDKALLTAFR